MPTKRATINILLKRFTSFDELQIEEIMKLLEKAKEVDTVDDNMLSWNLENVNKCLNLFSNFFSYKVTSSEEGMSLELNPMDINSTLIAYLSIFQYNFSNRIRTTSNHVYDSSSIRIKNLMPKIKDFKGYIIDEYRCEGDYAKYTDYLFFGIGHIDNSRETVIFFRTTFNQMRRYFGIRRQEIGSYIDFHNKEGTSYINDYKVSLSETWNNDDSNDRFVVPDSLKERPRKKKFTSY